MFNRRISAIVAILALGAFACAQGVPSAEKVIADAKAIAAKEKKAIWVKFDASW